ncbi:M1 family metallopeptidase [Nocardioides plantarum]|uniref:Aminopeptidase N n=1 Tax=Nocardioides plantarum TaxID=29299 RepID=A0ABV5KDD6_9ACTN|nr:M1 family metallopeptidase [Nocardioides plantarum]
MRSRAVRLVAPVLVLAVTALAALAPSSAARPSNPMPPARPQVGASGIGDPYWPLDGNGGLDVRHYDIAVRYDFDTGRLTGTTTLRVRPTADLSRFGLDLLLPVSTVTVDGRPATFDKPARHELRITPQEPLVRGTDVDVVVGYAGDPSRISYAGESRWLVGADEVVTVGQPHMAPWWFAANDHPRDKATFDITVTGPASYQAVSNGLPVQRTLTGAEATTHWRSAHPMTTYSAFFALGRYDVEQTSRAGLASYTAVSRSLPSSERSRAATSLRRTGAITAWLETRLGPYPFESTGGLVTSQRVGYALENQTRPVYPGPPARGLLVHELAHQWFGDSVSLQRWRDIWLNEGFATFMEVAYAERHGGPSAQQWLRGARDDQVGSRWFWRVDLTDPGAGRIFDPAVYQRGAMTLQALRHRIGERRFWRLLRTWTHDRRHGTGSTWAFRTLAERISGQQLDDFFSTWLREPRPPAPTRSNGLH